MTLPDQPVQLNPGTGGAKVRTLAQAQGDQQVITRASSYGHLEGPPLLLGVPLVNPVNASGDTTIYTPQSGKSIRLTWIHLSAPGTNTAEALARLRFSSQALAQSFYNPSLSNPGVFSHRCDRVGAVNDSLVLNLSVGSQPVYVSFDIEEV